MPQTAQCLRRGHISAEMNSTVTSLEWLAVLCLMYHNFMLHIQLAEKTFSAHFLIRVISRLCLILFALVERISFLLCYGWRPPENTCSKVTNKSCDRKILSQIITVVLVVLRPSPREKERNDIFKIERRSCRTLQLSKQRRIFKMLTPYLTIFWSPLICTNTMCLWQIMRDLNWNKCSYCDLTQAQRNK